MDGISVDVTFRGAETLGQIKVTGNGYTSDVDVDRYGAPVLRHQVRLGGTLGETFAYVTPVEAAEIANAWAEVSAKLLDREADES